jgi:WD40 repeat protein
MDGSVRFWDAHGTTELATLIGHTAQVSSARLSTDGQLVLTSAYDGTTRLWRWQRTRRTHLLPVMSSIDVEKEMLAILETRKSQLPSHGLLSPHDTLAGTFDEKRNLWLTPLEGGRACRIGDGTHAVTQSAFTPDERYVFTAEAGSTQIGMWKASDCSFVRALAGHTAEVLAVSVSDDGRFVLSGSADATARVWDTATGALVRTLSGNGASVVQTGMSASGDLVFTSSAASKPKNDAKLRFSAWRIRDGSLAWSRKPIPDQRMHEFFLRLPRGRLLICDRISNEIELVEAATGHVLRKREMPVGFFDMAATPDGRRLVTTNRGQNSVVLNGDTLDVEGEIESNNSHAIAFSRDSQLVFAGLSGATHVFDLESRRLIAQRPDADIVVAAHDSDRVLFIAGSNAAPRVWEFGTDPVSSQRLHEIVRCRVPFKMENGRVTKVTTTPTGCPAEL